MSTPTDSPSPAAKAEALSPADGEFLAAVGRRVRQLRERRGMARKVLAREAGLSERYLAQLEAGERNVSVLLLRQIAGALSVSLTEMLVPEDQDSVEKRLIRRFLERVPAHRVEDVIFRLMREFGHDEAVRRKRIALVGLRGAGKSTLGGLLAQELRQPFIELDREIERETGLPLAEVFMLYGQAGYRQIERRCLERVLQDNERAVISVGGGVVAEEETFNLLLAQCWTVWLKARPEDHMARVLAQGDLRPIAGHDEAMEDLQRILSARDALYRKADSIVDTSGETPEESLLKLRRAVAA